MEEILLFDESKISEDVHNGPAEIDDSWKEECFFEPET